eukprot:66028-Amphidinium_carterae.1
MREIARELVFEAGANGSGPKVGTSTEKAYALQTLECSCSELSGSRRRLALGASPCGAFGEGMRDFCAFPPL